MYKMVDNLYNDIESDANIKEILTNAQDKLVILMFYSKGNPNSRRLLGHMEKIALNHCLSIFCVINMDKVQERDSRFFNNVTVPQFDFYYQTNRFATYTNLNTDKDIEQCVRMAEQYVVTQNNSRNNGQNNQSVNMFGSNSQMNTMNQINPMLVQQQILNNMQMTNPQMYTYLLQNPMTLNQLTQQQIQQMQQMQKQPMQSGMTNMINMPNVSNMIGMSNMNSIPNTIPQIPTNIATNQSSIPSIPSLSTNNNDPLPTMQQLEKWFKLFQMMSAMGILNTSATPIIPEQNQNQSNDEYEIEAVLPDGRKIYKLPDGRFGVCK
ncbi:hypothetical protein [Acanthamoeba castellanii mimivirus]|uniref:Uncharacterized protein R467 n=5 Tax=Mimivirus TaxID=315393 RepID=YR467_MIMIV|nr:hypothetical protein MIMI_gp0501 [Acanthamoeba polyphaga mimivirus]Q5UQD4.1 RecName: Full=Uncharacterized protein R467 [Acanthamoeba polyphaga mimivirus]AHJ40150.1 hypothetical protein [Samba virus]ALR84057.1 hypothetical protein [Niemeyer virus]AMZ02911.1 hypothetical protein [Mimivirus Bombay]EJN40901.1 hypothetical protein lvs_R397 [Acanthamoeba polyphaga lentillevirus]BAV61571.1 hypothetical protein [Acanthamoeba castellanii mimivirus]